MLRILHSICSSIYLIYRVYVSLFKHNSKMYAPSAAWHARIKFWCHANVSQKATHLLQLNASSKGIAHVPSLKDMYISVKVACSGSKLHHHQAIGMISKSSIETNIL
jgi:hypothetical protein